ncbi:DUF2075 domain-containing protein [Clostridioides difficile]
MIVYRASKSEFMEHVENDIISLEIDRKYKEIIGKSNYREFKSWDNSMQYIYKALNSSNIPDNCGVAIEYRIPATSRRIDFIITGLDYEDKHHIIIVELKQWETVQKVDDEDAVVKTMINRHVIKTTHPSYQAWSYASLIEDYNDSVEKKKIVLHPCAYLHNYIAFENDDPLLSENYNEYINRAPVFTKGDAVKLRKFISNFVKRGDEGKGLFEIENGKIRPSKSLQDALILMLDGNEEFLMIDDQKVVFEKVRKTTKKAMLSGEKKVFIIEGGPGTGKSVLAINLLVKLLSENLLTYYVSKNSAPREVYNKKLRAKYKKKYIDNLFKGSGCFIDVNYNEIDVILVDEAHRLMKKSGIFKNLGENQVKEIIKSSKVSVFFIDENQRVTIDDNGSIKEIEKFASEFNAKVTKLKLTSQFRCNGSDGYLSWLDDVLEIRNTGNFDGFEFDYDIKIMDNPNEVYNKIKELNKENNKARMLAGYCWDWISKKDINEYDISIDEYDFKMKWNLSNTKTWAIDDDSINEVGCIHTAQGLEFDYVGIIIGEDIKVENNKIVTDFTKRAKTDKSLNGIKKLYKENPEKALEIADEIIKNTYRTLMTRGQKGCYIYCVDKALANYLKTRVELINYTIKFKDITNYMDKVLL